MKQRVWVVLALVLAAPAALAAAAEERLARDYLQAAARAEPARMLDFYHPNEISELRARVLKVLDEQAAGGADDIRVRVFGVATSLEDVKRLTPGNLFLKLAARVQWPSAPLQKVEVLGVIEEKTQQAHVLGRLVPPADSQARAQLAVVTLLRHGKGWGVALPTAFQSQVDRLLSPSQPDKPADQDASSPGAVNTPGIERMLASGVALLREAECAQYFNEHMSPQFRSMTSKPALQRLIAQCERSIDTRETYITALQVVKDAAPRYENEGARAVYDLSGKGLPFERFVLEKVDERWYVAE